MFNMPEWKETRRPGPPADRARRAGPTFPATPTDDGSTAVDFIAMEHSPTKSVSSATVIPVGRHRIPSRRRRAPAAAWRRTSRPRCRRDRADPARHLRLHREDRSNAADGGRHRRDPLQRGRHARAHATRCSARPTRATRSRPCSRATPSARSSTTSLQGRPAPDGHPRDQRRRPASASIPNVVAETKRRRPEPHRARAARTWTPCPAGPGHQRRRLGHLVPARAGRADREGGHADAQQDPLPVLRRRGGRPGRLAVLRRAHVRRRGRREPTR